MLRAQRSSDVSSQRSRDTIVGRIPHISEAG
jgi:hypothetical protein